MKKIKLLLVASVFGDRGAEALMLYLYKYLPRDTYEIKLICLRDFAPFAEHLNNNTDIKIDIIGMKYNLDIASLFRFYKHMKDFKPDIVNFHHYRAALWGRPLAKLAKIPVILYSVHNKWGGTLHHFLDKLLARFTDAIVPFSYAVRNYLMNDEKIHEKYIEKPIYAGVDISRFSNTRKDEIDELRKELHIIEQQNIIGYIGNINMEKGLLYLIKSVKKLSPAFSDLCCLMVGEGPDEEFLKEKITEYNLWNHFKFLGQRHDIHNLLNIMKVFILPSLSEGLPVVVVEALSASCPVVATNIDGIPEIITHRKNGLLVPPCNVAELSNAIESLLSSEKMRDEYAKNGYQTAVDKFSIKKMVKNYDNLYQNYLNRQL